MENSSPHKPNKEFVVSHIEDNVILPKMANMLNGYFGNQEEVIEPNVVSLAFELAIEEEMAAMLSRPLEVLIK